MTACPNEPDERECSALTLRALPVDLAQKRTWRSPAIPINPQFANGRCMLTDQLPAHIHVECD